MTDQWKVLGLSEGFCVMGDGCRRAVTPRWWEGGLGALLSTLAPHYGFDGGVLILDRSATLALGLPVEGVPFGGIDHPALDDATRAGWSHKGRLSDWTHFRAPDRPSLHLCIEPLLSTKFNADGVAADAPFWRSEFHDTVRSLALWHLVSGVPWRGSPGMAGMAILKKYAQADNPQRNTYGPTWKPTGLWIPDGLDEQPYRIGDFRNPPPPDSGTWWMHGYDQNRSYIAAAMLVEPAAHTLRHTGRIAFSRRLGGAWECELAPWNDPRMPDPAGYREGENRTGGRVRWLTTERVALLEELTTEGVYGGVRIIDSYTAPAKKGVLRPWAERMRDMYVYKDPRGRDLSSGLTVADQIRIQIMTKEVGRRTLSMLTSPGNWCTRPDWWYSTVALQAANLWRRMWAIGKAEDRWPVAIDVDNVYYASRDRDPEASIPVALVDLLDPAGEKLGGYKTHHTYRYPPRRKATA